MNINFSDEKQKKFFYMLVAFFKIHNIPYYVGGSRYFGCNNFDSDLNIFISLNPEQKEAIPQKLIYCEFISTTNICFNNNIFENPQFHHIENNIQITIIRDAVFQSNKIIHRKIKEEINADRNIIPILKKLKELGKSGSDMYNFLKKVFRLQPTSGGKPC